MSNRHQRTLEAIFERPTRGDIPWRDIQQLFIALGGDVTNGAGSRRRVKLGERRAVFHEPHPERETDKGAVVDVRGFLISAGVRP
ncbi:type II toxin-antitoxin system HicA family toxin [Singulisphaera sp. GP187]|uniref:type II toxin-antitoxin system HicA family toxin n=1 Tax=Singulisphaera sp. GP187 TaxID=1882752 RepID=UPI000941236D